MTNHYNAKPRVRRLRRKLYMIRLVEAFNSTLKAVYLPHIQDVIYNDNVILKELK